MTKVLVQLRSAAMPQHAKAKAIAATGVSSPDIMRAARRFFRRLTPILGPLPNRMRMTMRLRYQSNRFCDTVDLSNTRRMRTYKTALFGAGFVGRVHLEGLRRLGYA